MRKALFALILVVTVLFALSKLRAEQAPWNSIYQEETSRIAFSHEVRRRGQPIGNPYS